MGGLGGLALPAQLGLNLVDFGLGAGSEFINQLKGIGAGVAAADLGLLLRGELEGVVEDQAGNVDLFGQELAAAQAPLDTARADLTSGRSRAKSELDLVLPGAVARTAKTEKNVDEAIALAEEEKAFAREQLDLSRQERSSFVSGVQATFQSLKEDIETGFGVGTAKINSAARGSAAAKKEQIIMEGREAGLSDSVIRDRVRGVEEGLNLALVQNMADGFTKTIDRLTEVGVAGAAAVNTAMTTMTAAVIAAAGIAGAAGATAADVALRGADIKRLAYDVLTGVALTIAGKKADIEMSVGTQLAQLEQSRSDMAFNGAQALMTARTQQNMQEALAIQTGYDWADRGLQYFMSMPLNIGTTSLTQATAPAFQNITSTRIASMQSSAGGGGSGLGGPIVGGVATVGAAAALSSALAPATGGGSIAALPVTL